MCNCVLCQGPPGVATAYSSSTQCAHVYRLVPATGGYRETCIWCGMDAPRNTVVLRTSEGA